MVDDDNGGLKKGFEKDVYDNHRKMEIAKCMTDPFYFIENYMIINEPSEGDVKFKLYPYQKKIVDGFYKHKDVILLCARQMGKCVSEKTPIRLRSPNGKVIEMTVGEFYELQKRNKKM